jgi:hypothetical protein
VSQHPYRRLPDKAFWRRSVAAPDPGAIDPVGRFDLRIGKDSKVATAGSCFAQHIARHLKLSGYNYYVAETAHPIMPGSVAQAHNYGLFSARYGNLYTSRQLLQLLRRAYGKFTPKDDVWTGPDGGVVDPFRPTIQPGGFATEAEMRADREWHLARVREMFETLDVFVFTLGLTECWLSRKDGAVYPICPGVDGGVFDPGKYVFHNLDVNEVYEDVRLFIKELRLVNPKAEVLLTVSPVPLAATAEPDAHVLAATTYSKAVLRAAAGMLNKRMQRVHYFPSYEIITSSASRGAYYADDLRNVTEDGVSHVMRLFLQHATGDSAASGENAAAPPAAARPESFLDKMNAWVEVMCDEERLDA